MYEQAPNSNILTVVDSAITHIGLINLNVMFIYENLFQLGVLYNPLERIVCILGF